MPPVTPSCNFPFKIETPPSACAYTRFHFVLILLQESPMHERLHCLGHGAVRVRGRICTAYMLIFICAESSPGALLPMDHRCSQSTQTCAATSTSWVFRLPSRSTYGLTNLPAYGTDRFSCRSEFTAIFSEYGTVAHCVILATVDNASRRRGFVVMSTHEEAKNAMANLSRTQIKYVAEAS